MRSPRHFKVVLMLKPPKMGHIETYWAILYPHFSSSKLIQAARLCWIETYILSSGQIQCWMVVPEFENMVGDSLDSSSSRMENRGRLPYFRPCRPVSQHHPGQVISRPDAGIGNPSRIPELNLKWNSDGFQWIFPSTVNVPNSRRVSDGYPSTSTCPQRAQFQD